MVITVSGDRLEVIGADTVVFGGQSGTKDVFHLIPRLVGLTRTIEKPVVALNDGNIQTVLFSISHTGVTEDALNCAVLEQPTPDSILNFGAG